MLRSRAYFAAALYAICIILFSPPASIAAPPPASNLQAKIKELEAYYAKVYAEPLNSTDRLPREIAIISLSRLDSPDTTTKLLDALKTKDHDPVVAYLAWQALEPRADSLTAEQRRRWLVAGVQAANNGAFPGSTVAPLLRALAQEPPALFENDLNRLLLRVIEENDPQDAAGRSTLDALANLLATWHDPTHLRLLIANLGRAQLMPRIDQALRKLPDAPDNADPKKLIAQWRAWPQQHANLKPASAEELKPIAAKSTLFPKPGRIVDPLDKRWRAELEISKLTVSDFDLVWCIDSTGSMNEPNQLIAAETAPVMRACSLMSKRARCGVVYYRHETDPALMKPCCQRAAGNARFYQVKGYPLTIDARALSTKMAAEPIPKPDPTEGNIHPGSAICAGMKAAMTDMNWSNDKHARRILVLVGDAMVTPGSEKSCEELGVQAKTKGYLVHALIRPRVKESWDPLIKSSGASFNPFVLAGPRRDAFNPATELADIMVQIITESIAPDYKDRVEPLLHILIPYAKAADLAEQRARAAK